MQYTVATFHPSYITRKNRRFDGIVSTDLRRLLNLSQGWRPKWNDNGYKLAPDVDTVERMLKGMHGHRVAFDFETDGQHPLICQARCLAFTDGESTVCVPFLKRVQTEVEVVGKTGKRSRKLVTRWQHFYSPEHLKRVLVAIQALFNSKGLQLDTQNGQFDRLVAKHGRAGTVRLGLIAPSGPPHFDTMVGHHVLTSYHPHSLGFLASHYTDIEYYKANDEGAAWSSESDLELWAYCCRDVRVTRWVATSMRQEVATEQNAAAIYRHDARQEAECQRWREVGVKVDLEALGLFRLIYHERAVTALARMREVLAKLTKKKAHHEELDALLEVLAGQADEVEVGDDGSTAELFNPGSLRQLRMLLRALGIPLSEKTATGELSTAREFLDTARKALIDEGASPTDSRIAFLDYLFAWREAAKVEGTYLNPEVLPDGRIHPSFSVHIVPTGRLSSSNPNCFSGDTEVLTPEGWSFVADVVRKGKRGVRTPIAQWYDDGKLSFVTPTAYVERTGTNKWVHLSNEHVDLLVTEDHRCPLLHRKTNQLKVFPAAAYPEDWKQLNAVDGWVSEGRLQLDANLLRLIVAIQADGAITKSGGLDFSLHKARKQKRLRMLLSSLGLAYRESERKPDARTGNTAKRFYVAAAPVLAKALSFLVPFTKSFGPWVLSLSPEQRAVLAEEVMLWDGCATRMNHYASQHPENADWVQLAYVLNGKRANVRKYYPKPSEWNPDPKVSYQVDVSRNEYSFTTNIGREYYTSEATAYCVNVPTSYLLVRRNGKVMVSGNCQNQPSEIRGMYIPEEGYVFVMGDWDSLEMRLGALLSGDSTFIEEFKAYDEKRGPKIHILNMAAIFGLPATPEAAEANHGCYVAAKTFAYGVAYGSGLATAYESVHKLMPDLDFETFKLCYERYKKKRARLFAFQAEVVKRGTQNQKLESSILKRPVYFFELSWNQDSPEASRMQNMPYQSGGADVVSLANFRIMDRVVIPLRRKLTKGQHIEQLAQVHDELLFEVPEAMAEELKKGFKAVGEEPPSPAHKHWHLPIEVDVVKRWKPIKFACTHKGCLSEAKLEPTSRKGLSVTWGGVCKDAKHPNKYVVPKSLCVAKADESEHRAAMVLPFPTPKKGGTGAGKAAKRKKAV